MYVLVYGLAAKANLHRTTCACAGRTERHRTTPEPETLPTTVTTLVGALHAPPVKRATAKGYRVIVSKCVRRD